MSMNGISNTFIPNTLSGLESFNATNITINGVDISTIYVPFVNSPLDVDLASKNLTTGGRIQTTVLKLPSATYSTTKVLRVNATKEVESVDLVSTFLPYSGATSDLDMGTKRIIYYQGAYPTSDNDVINRLYVQSYYLSLTDASSTYLTIANASSTYLTIANASSTYQTQAGMPSFNFTGTPTIASAPSATDDSDKIPTTHWVNYAMSLIYLPITTAASTYLTITNAASTYATITNLNLKANSASPTFTGTVTLPSTVNFTINPVSGTGTLLAINGSGNLITTTASVNQTATSTSGTYYLTFVASSATQSFTPLVFSQIMCNPNVGLIEVNNMKITSRNLGGSQASLLGRDSAGNVIDGFMSQTASSANTDFPVGFIQSSGTGLFTPLNETSGAFTFNPSTLSLKTSKLQITSVPTGTQSFLLAVDSAGNVIQGTSAGGVTSFSAGSTGFLPNSATTGAIILSGNLNVANGGTGATTTTGTGANVLSVSPALTGTPTAPTAGAGTNTTQIATTAFVTTAVSAFTTPTQINPTPINTSTTLYPVFLTSTAGGASTTYVESDGSLFYNPSTNRLTVPIVSASSVVETSAIQNSSGQIININVQGGAIAGNRLNLQIQSTTYYYFDKDAFYLTQPVNNVISSITNDLYILWPSAKILSLNNWVTIDNTGLLMTGTRPVFTQNVTTQATTDLNLNVPTATNFINFNFNGVNISKATNDGFWIPSNGATSFYITDTAPRTGTSAYGRYFGLGGSATIYQDFYNRFLWRTTDLSGTTISDIMYLRNSGLNINQSSTTHPDLSNYELVVGNNSSTVNSSAKIIIRGKSTTTGFGPSVDFTSYDSHTTAQATIEVVDGGNWDGIFRLRAKAPGAGAAGAMTTVLSLGTAGWLFPSTPAQNTTQNINYVYRAQYTTDIMYLCQDEEFFFYYNGQWSVGRYLGTFTKVYQGSKIRVNCAATQYATAVGTVLCQIAIYNQTTATWYYANQGTFFNYTGGHFCTPNIDTFYNLPAGTYEVWCNGNGVTDGNDVLRLHVSVSP